MQKVILIKPREAASILAISIKHLVELTMAGEIPFINVGAQSRVIRRYHPDDIEAFIEARKTRVTPYSRPFGSYSYKRVAVLKEERKHAEYIAHCQSSFAAAQAARLARLAARQAVLNAADEKRRIHAEGVAARKAERLAKKAEKERNARTKKAP